MTGPAWIFLAMWAVTSLAFVIVNSDRELWRDRAEARWRLLEDMERSVDAHADQVIAAVSPTVEDHPFPTQRSAGDEEMIRGLDEWRDERGQS